MRTWVELVKPGIYTRRAVTALITAVITGAVAALTAKLAIGLWTSRKTR